MAEQEPNGWELLRAVKDIGLRLDEFGRNYVPIAVYTTLVERVRQLEAEIKGEQAGRSAAIGSVRAELEAQNAALRKELDDQRKVKAQQWSSIGLLAVGGLVAVVFQIFRQGIGLP